MKAFTVVVACLVAATAASSANMNGKYSIASGGNQDVPYNDDYASKGYEYFDVWAPEIATHYAQVFWTSQGTLPLPDAIKQRFAGKTMAIVGYEQDQVMVNPVGHPGENPEDDVSVPINWAYNHHYMAYMMSDDAELTQIDVDPNDVGAHGAPRKWTVVDKPSAALRADTSIPTKQMFSEGNGGESRKSYHGYPKGFAQLIDSPTTWTITPMQIDTRNRDCGVTPADIHNCTEFTPGPEPRQSRYGLGIPSGTNYSGILECPCNGLYGGDPSIYGPTTKTKDVEHKYSAIPSGVCSAGEDLVSSTTCFEAASSIGVNGSKYINQTVSDMTLPSGCSIKSNDDGTVTTVYNSAHSSTPCTDATKRMGEAATEVGTKMSLSLDQVPGDFTFKRSPKGEYCSDNKVNIIKSFEPPTPSTSDAEKAVSECEAFCKTSSSCWGCSVDLVDSTTGMCRWLAIPQCGTVRTWTGKVDGDITQKVGSGNVTLTLSGPSTAWFGFGFDAVEMSDAPYTIIVNDTGVMERQIGTCGSEAEHCPGDLLTPSVTLVSNNVIGGVRTVVLTRTQIGATSKHYTFGASTIPFISAIGSSQTFAYHQAHTASVVTLLNEDGPTCLCDLGAAGQLCETNGTACDSFVKTCVAAPAGSLLAQHNPTCNSRQYAGGLRCCHHGRIMLDADQEQRPELLRYHMKFRFWFQEYTPATSSANASHADLPRIYQQTEANAGEYDIPPAFAKPGKPIPGYNNWPENVPTPGTTCTGTCPDGPDCECIHTIEYHWNVSNIRLIYAGGHCHAPSCVSMELYRNDTGTPKLLCRQIPKIGTGDIVTNKYDEAGYIALPPCLWGEDDGLTPSEFLPENTPLYSIKRNRNTHMGHYGEMASWQMRGVNF